MASSQQQTTFPGNADDLSLAMAFMDLSVKEDERAVADLLPELLHFGRSRCPDDNIVRYPGAHAFNYQDTCQDSMVKLLTAVRHRRPIVSLPHVARTTLHRRISGEYRRLQKRLEKHPTVRQMRPSLDGQDGSAQETDIAETALAREAFGQPSPEDNPWESALHCREILERVNEALAPYAEKYPHRVIAFWLVRYVGERPESVARWFRRDRTRIQHWIKYVEDELKENISYRELASEHL